MRALRGQRLVNDEGYAIAEITKRCREIDPLALRSSRGQIVGAHDDRIPGAKIERFPPAIAKQIVEQGALPCGPHVSPGLMCNDRQLLPRRVVVAHEPEPGFVFLLRNRTEQEFLIPRRVSTVSALGNHAMRRFHRRQLPRPLEQGKARTQLLVRKWIDLAQQPGAVSATLFEGERLGPEKAMPALVRQPRHPPAE